MPEPTFRIEDILVELNGPTGIGEWQRVPGYLGVSKPSISSDTSLNFLAPLDGVAVILFVNNRTTELKMYAAKLTNDPIREQLWPQG